ncbi:lysophospholipid acyltransferase family protein [Thermosipho atlanticus]|uniref:lysophospholipid acyltransferase family protein n=1 Tax=Thermosipho atlanticus TaxID=238991 RepID=UPI001F28C295|nr:lysophospholipid acyltransferase family protein [Thermosipho atlanticus]
MQPIWLLRPVLAPFFKKHYNLILKGNFPSPPFLLIANHTHTFDPLFISTFFKMPICWVVAKGNFNRIIIGPLFKSLKFISKQKGEPDIGTIRGILRNLKDGNVVGIFPEGSVTWDGNFQELPSGTDKLLEMVKVPIVSIRIKGGYLSNPRWANYGRKGKIILEVKQFHGKEALDFIKHNE